MTTHDDPESLENVRGPSKSRRKRDSFALQDLGAELMNLTPLQLERLDLPAELLEAVLIGKAITAHGGLARQRKYIGKLLRALDPEPIQTGLEALRGESVEQIRLQHAAEDWRARMIAEGDEAINAYMALCPSADRQRLRQLVREVHRESEGGRPPRSARMLYRTIRETLSGADDVD